jgi:hypothetical protein
MTWSILPKNVNRFEGEFCATKWRKCRVCDAIASCRFCHGTGLVGFPIQDVSRDIYELLEKL